MLIRLTGRLQLRAAMALAAVYAVCVLAPAVAVAFTGGGRAAHCLTDDRHGLAHVHTQHVHAQHLHAQGDVRAIAHVHGDGAAHEHAGQAHDEQTAPAADEQPGLAGSCCGLFCHSAATGDILAVVARPVHASRIVPALGDSLDGRAPDRIHRPPRSPLSL